MKKEMEKVITTASALFSHSGIRSITVDDIMRNCSMSKRTFYEHFNSKEDLMNQILAQWTTKSARYLSMNRYISVNAISEMTNFFCTTEKLLRRIRPIFFHELKKYHAGSWQMLDQFSTDSLVPFVLQNIDRGQKEAIYRNNINKALVVEIYFSSLQMVLEEPRMQGADLESIYHEMNILFLHGLVNVKGMKLMDEKTG